MQKVTSPRNLAYASIGWRYALAGLITLGACLGVLASTRADDNPATERLGERLFNDSRLSSDGTIKCASCHEADRGFTDGKPVAVGVRSQAGLRNAQSLLNVGHQTSYFWDGRRRALEEQVLDPLSNPIEHGLGSVDDVLSIIIADPSYVAAFKQAFPSRADRPVTAETVARALASYVRTLVSPESAIDRFVLNSDTTALGVDARAGFEVFNRALCSGCHTLAADPTTGRVLLTDDRFHASGATAINLRKTLEALAQDIVKGAVPMEALDSSALDALGRFVVSRNPTDAGAFKTPSLRNVARTAPYFHDGSAPTLEDAVDRELSVSTGAIQLSALERRQLLSFLRVLTDDPPAAAPSRQIHASER